MTLALLLPTLRAAARAHLLDVVDIDHQPGVSVTLAGGVFARASGSWIDAGFAEGQEVTVSGFTGSPLVGVVSKVEALALTTDIAGGETVAGGGRFVVALPSERAWEGETQYAPITGKPYVSEVFRSGPSNLRSIGNPGGGTIEHIKQGHYGLHYPSEIGTLALERMAGAVQAHFRPAQSIERDGVAAWIIAAQPSAIITDGGWQQITVSVTFRTHTQD